MKKVLTVLLILAMVFSLAGFAVAEDSVDTMPQSACLDCGFSEGHDVSCPLYAAELPLPEFSDACSECGGVFGEHAESCSAYVISDDESSFADVPQTGDEPVDGDDTLLPKSPETPDTPQSFSGQLLAADTLEEMYSLMLSAMDEDISLLYQLTAEELAVLKSHADGLYLGIAEPVDGDDTDNWEGIISTLTVLEEEQAGVDRDVAVYGSSTTSLSGNGYIYFDLSAGNVVITAESYTGYVFISGSPEIRTGTHTASNKYYIYQTNDSKSSDIPAYERVGHPTESGKYWGAYIINNTDVKSVSTNWGDQAGKVGRTSTNNYIKIEGDGNFNLTIDNLWSLKNEAGTSRVTGGICYDPDDTEGYDSLNITFKGDNRFGNIFYRSKSSVATDDHLIFNGERDADGVNATLTVASYNGYENHYNSVIGSSDNPATHDSVCEIVINSGIIYAGAWKKGEGNYTNAGTAAKDDNCGAIGGGGNGRGTVTITGGIVTAVAHTSGATIGGGIGWSSIGATGTVTISGGDVYAYNFGHEKLPATAIGGSGSNAEYGGQGFVTISGGNVYAESDGGAAIGGGSSNNKNGGHCTIVINGTANVTAKSVNIRGLGYGAAIGGGTGKTSGGSANLQVSENAILNTGSIGGGKGNVIGSAQVNISGGTLLGQVIMEGTGSTFNMTGGEINNANHAGYNFLQKDGGAVWIQTGEASMSGGIIKNANAKNGGAIYVKGGSFELSGDGTIQNCTATENGGAVYVSGGTVTMDGGTITGVSANEGGAVYVSVTGNPDGNSFTMSNGTIQNATATYGNGGAVAVANGKASMSNGSIQRSTATGNGGAVAVSNGDFVISGGTIQTVGAKGNGGAVSVSGSGSVEMRGSAVIKNTTTQGNGGAVSVSGGSFTMSGGTIGGTDTEKCTASQNGGGVAVDGGTFTMNDGTMQNCTATGNGGSVFVSGGTASVSGGSLSYCSAVNGGAVYVFVNDNSQDSFTMSGTASITGCTASENGGAVCVAGGSAGMSGGSISNCTATGNGGAVSVSGSGSVEMSGSAVIKNTTTQGNGGAVYVSVTGNPTEDSFTMSGGIIKNANANATSGNGGAVCVAGGNARMKNGDIENCSAKNGGAVYISNGNFTIDSGDVSSCNATGNGGAVAVLNGHFVMDSGNLTANTAAQDGGGAYVNGGSITIGNVICEEGKNATHVHPTTKNNNAKNGGAFSVSGGTLTVYCGEYSGNTANASNSDSIYQTNGKVHIFKGVDEASLPLSEVLITGNMFVYTDARSTIFKLTLYRSPDDSAPVSILLNTTEYHSIRLNKSLLNNQTPLYPGTQLMGWSTTLTDNSSTVKDNPEAYYPENSRYPVTGGGHVNISAIWGHDVLNYTIMIPESLDFTVNGDKATIKVGTASPFFIPDGVGRVNVTLSTFSGKLTLQEKPDQNLSYSLWRDTTQLNEGDVVASFTYDKNKKYQSQAVTLSAIVSTEPIYAGTYQETVTFTASVVMDAYDSNTSDSKYCYMGDSQ